VAGFVFTGAPNGYYRRERNTPCVTLDAAVNYLRFGRASIDRPTAAYVGSPVQTAILTDGHTRNTHVFVLALGARIGL